MTTELTTTTPAPLATTQRTDALLVEKFLRSKGQRSEHTRAQYEHSLRLLLGYLNKPLQEVTSDDALDYHDHLKETYTSLHSIKLHVNVAKSLFSYALAKNYLVTNVFTEVKPDSTPEITHKRILTEEEVLRLIDAPGHERDKLILRLLYAAGLRVSELCALMWDDLSKDGVLHVRTGKGQKERFITLSDSTHKKLTKWQASHQGDTYIFTSQVTELGGAAYDGRLTPMQIHRIIKRAALASGVSPDTSAHWLRHSHGSHALDRGASIVTVRDTLGHASIATTNKYLHGKRGESTALNLAV